MLQVKRIRARDADHARSRAPARLLHPRRRTTAVAQGEEPRHARHQGRPGGDRARARRPAGRHAARLSGRARQRSRRARGAPVQGRRQIRAAQRHHARHRQAVVSRSQGHQRRDIRRLRLRQGGRTRRRRRCRASSATSPSIPRRAGDREVLLRRAQLQGVGLAQRLLRFPALQPSTTTPSTCCRPTTPTFTTSPSSCATKPRSTAPAISSAARTSSCSGGRSGT